MMSRMPTTDTVDSTWFTPLTPLVFLERSADVFGDKEAIVYGDQRTTYREFAAEATRLAHALTASGVAAGDRVAYLLPNIPPMLVAHFGVPLAGAILVAINTRLAPAEISYIIGHSGARLLVVDSGLHASIAPVADEIDVEIVTVNDPASGAEPDPALGGSATTTCSPAAATTPCHGTSTTSARRSRSTTRPVRPASRRG